ncbi:hypothetical protein Cylst_5039 [Cylindrospermum stagnale PCC 7417]|uniref:DUF4402 domain-containing protein n=1 Tax=Cylindrospermum stagnale PCC 7417 TaxID=56107 RepID=K9X3S7_9NOST|nr:hypothetical protein [Cylindrospermum stagnale]AFZ27088.1 hypothetical protein Cylst_5039 [Cylindrospermum stagnale PCC 7417]
MPRNKTISCQHHLFKSLGITIALLGLQQPSTLAQSLFGNPEPTEINQLSTPQSLDIPPIAQTEISPTRNESVTNEQDLLAPPQFNIVITRDFSSIWQMRVPIDQVNSLYATYALKAGNGQNGVFSSQQNSNSTVQVSLEPLAITEVSRDQNSNTALVQGGVRLRMNLAKAQLAGAYAGQLTVTVNSK